MDRGEFKQVIETLKDMYPISYPEHIKPLNPFATLIGTILSHRTRDENTDQAFISLFKRYKTPHEIARAPTREIEKLIKAVGFYRQKAKRIKQVSKIILERYKGQVPKSREELMKLPGVGPKTADIVLSLAYGMPEVAVDTHVETIAKRLGVAPENADYETIKKNIEELVEVSDRRLVNTLFVKFGKEICKKPKPKCNICPLTKLCEYYKHNIQP